MARGSRTSFEPAPQRPKRPPPLAVGSHAFVSGVHLPGQRPGEVLLTDESGTPTRGMLPDGEEVEILAWSTKRSVRYQVHCLGSGAQGWLIAQFLRKTREPLPEASAPALPPAPRDTGAETGRPWSGAPPSNEHAAAERATPPLGDTARTLDNALVHCPVCHRRHHPHNLLRSVTGTVLGCLVCQGRRP